MTGVGRLVVGALVGAGGLLALVSMAKAEPIGPQGPTFESTGASGTTWTLENLGQNKDGETVVQVWIESGGKGAWTRVLRYAQTGTDKESRRSLGSPFPADAEILRRAKADFGVP